VPAITFLGLWFLFELWKGTALLGQDPSQVGGIAFWAHVGGFAAGVLLHGLFGGRRRQVRVEIRDQDRGRWPPSRPG
jgi:membrane associated rhomboid family serine protease